MNVLNSSSYSPPFNPSKPPAPQVLLANLVGASPWFSMYFTADGAPGCLAGRGLGTAKRSLRQTNPFGRGGCGALRRWPQADKTPRRRRTPAADAYHRAFAAYVRDNLRPDVNVYVEWANEVSKCSVSQCPFSWR